MRLLSLDGLPIIAAGDGPQRPKGGQAGRPSFDAPRVLRGEEKSYSIARTLQHSADGLTFQNPGLSCILDPASWIILIGRQ